MISGIIGRKVGMTQLFAEDGTVTPVTVIKAGPCVVVQTKSAAGRDGYNAVQLGLVEDTPIRVKRVKKPMLGHFEKTGGGIPPTRVLKEIRLEAEPEASVGDRAAGAGLSGRAKRRSPCHREGCQGLVGVLGCDGCGDRI
ncbi:large ribosomal subunit protein uL3 [Leptolyngbya sp. 7M]|uniref:large ribosomal subunit protein uL3 n=1 Tax=Leptolyngbya sp. 7M TaxID=2812896 RepID=UPI001B8B6619|nr:hypothetical protein [Leptolyngbya sp. 7M]QYO62984.1 hypothetical protein JVX88_23710 [Leptolyngbya sp. 7M]